LGLGYRQLLTILCITLSLALFSLGGADSASGFCLRTLSFSRPTTIVGPILDRVVVSHDVKGMTCDETGRHVSIYNALYCILQGPVSSLPRL
jgi:hypothetical protein